VPKLMSDYPHTRQGYRDLAKDVCQPMEAQLAGLTARLETVPDDDDFMRKTAEEASLAAIQAWDAIRALRSTLHR